MVEMTGTDRSLLAVVRAAGRPRRPAQARADGSKEQIARLIASLHGVDEGKRWRAAARLAKIGALAAQPLLLDIERSRLGARLRDSYLHILDNEVDAQVRHVAEPVRQALMSTDYRDAAPVAAARALRSAERANEDWVERS